MFKAPEEREINSKFWPENLKRRDHLNTRGVSGWRTLKCTQ